MSDRKTKLVAAKRQDYISTLTSIRESLREGDCIAQSNFVEKLLRLLVVEDTEQFLKEIDTVDMWGGSGAVWEVYIANKELATQFEKSMIDLINLMEETKIADRRMKSIRKLFIENLKSK